MQDGDNDDGRLRCWARLDVDCRLPMSVGRSRWHDNDDGADAGDEGGGVEGGVE